MEKNATGEGLQLSLMENIPPRFGPGFLRDHAGKILTDPKIAIVELVANSWDAGADMVDITWPANLGGKVTIQDNGTGMTGEEFINRWSQYSYNRKDEQGLEVIFPQNNTRSSRKAFGRNGKGRHGMFCFSNSYQVETHKGGEHSIFKVYRSDTLHEPFRIQVIERTEGIGNGTAISARMELATLSITDLKELIGSKFVADPSFRIKVNGDLVELTDLEHLAEISDLSIDGLGMVKVRHFDTRKTGRTSKQHGIAWWVNNRLVGQPSWRGFDESPYLDARKSEAKRHTFVIEADILQDSVEADWNGFRETCEFEIVYEKVKNCILDQLHVLFADLQKARKIEALTVNREEIKALPPESRKVIGSFTEEIQRESPTITQRDLDATVKVLINLEKSRSQFTLLEQLAKLNPDDLDGLSEILSQWTVSEARLVLDVLGKRLRLIETLEKLVENPSADELHEIQPLFEGGLWIFGPEYESIEFIANKSLSTVIRDLLHDKGVKLSTPKRRPDIIALADSTVGVYSSDAFDERSEVNGYAKVLIIELKKGGFTIATKERRQCEDYASELRKSSKVGRATKIIGFVLGATVEEYDQDESTVGLTVIYPRTYSVVLRQAHARTFNLLEKMKKIRAEKGIDISDLDPDIEAVINQPEQLELISSNNEII